MSDIPYDVDGALKWADTSKKMNEGKNPAELDNCMDYIALQTLADEVRKHQWIPVTERLPDYKNSCPYSESFVSVRKVWAKDKNKCFIVYFSMVNNKFYTDGTCIHEANIVAWQPLPKV
jgi:hypothetical protein